LNDIDKKKCFRYEHPKPGGDDDSVDSDDDPSSDQVETQIKKSLMQEPTVSEPVFFGPEQAPAVEAPDSESTSKLLY